MVTLKSGKSLRGDNAVNAGASTSSSSTNGQPKNCTTCQRNERASGTEQCADCQNSQRPESRLESTDTESSQPDIPPLASASEATVNSLVIDLNAESSRESLVIEDVVAEKKEKEEEEEDTDDEGPDYEPVWKRAKRDSVSPKTLLTIDDDLPTPPSRSDSPALTVLYDLTEDQEQSLENLDVDSDVEEVTFVKVTTNVKKPLIVIDDDDDGEVVDPGDRRRGVKREREASGVRKREVSSTSTLSKADDVDSSGKKGVEVTTPEKGDDVTTPEKGDEITTPERVGDGEEGPSGTPAPNEADEAVVSAAIEIIVNDVPEDPSPSPPRKRQPISASIEEIVPEKYRTLFFTFSSSSVTDDALWTLFTQFGDIQTLGVDVCPPDVVERQGRVIFKKFYAVDGCVKAKPLSVGGADINIRRTREKVEKNEHMDRIYVSGIYHLTSQDLTRYFASFGAIKETIVLSARGFAFIIFEDGDSVDKTLLQQFHLLDGLMLEVKRAFLKNPNTQRRPPPDPFRRPPPPKFDKGPRGRAPTLPVSITPFPRLVEIKPKPEPEGAVPLDRCESATSGSIASDHFKVKTEPVFCKVEAA